MVSGKRIDTLRMIIGSHPTLVSDARTGDVIRELQRVIDTKRISGGDRWLLQVLHTTRALDTCLARIIAQHRWAVTTPSLGGYLRELRDKGVIVEHQRHHWQNSLVGPRNLYMHSANMMPLQHTADGLLDEMDACMSIVLAAV